MRSGYLLGARQLLLLVLLLVSTTVPKLLLVQVTLPIMHETVYMRERLLLLCLVVATAAGQTTSVKPTTTATRWVAGHDPCHDAATGDLIHDDLLPICAVDPPLRVQPPQRMGGGYGEELDKWFTK